MAVADSSGGVHALRGLEVEELIALKARGAHVGELPGVTQIAGDAFVDVDCDIWVPAARPDVIDRNNAHRVRARLIVPGANIGVTEEAERLLHARGVLCIPDFISNAGGVICASVEYHGGVRSQAFAVIEEKIRTNTRTVLERAAQTGTLPRAAAVELATQRVRRAMQLRRWR